jgi:3-deoxy-D-manno-octulosonate 8-phosphate phosphatase (KDO 8-P phosphatase)
MNAVIQKKIKKIKVLVLDVDGVLTDGRIILDGDGKEIKNFDVQDGFGLVLFQKAGYKTAVISARAARAVTVRAGDLKMDRVYQDACPKTAAYGRLLQDLQVTDQEVCFVGDDLPDCAVLNRVGFAVAVANAVPEVKRRADYVTKNKGGAGAVREVVDLILKSNGQWKMMVSDYE